MKCVKNVHTNEIRRVSDEQANRLVMSGGHYFTPKSEWKALRVAPVKVEVALPSVEKPKKAKKGGK
jgi:hypothetical protein